MQQDIQVELTAIRTGRADRVAALHPPAAGFAQMQLDVLGRPQLDVHHRFGCDGDPAHPGGELGGAHDRAVVDGGAANRAGSVTRVHNCVTLVTGAGE